MSERLAAGPVALAGGRVAMLTFRPGRSRTPTSGIGLGTLILRVSLPERVLDARGEVLARNVEDGDDKLEVDGRGDLAIGWETLAGKAVTPVVEVRAAGAPPRRIRLPDVPDDWGAWAVAWGPSRDLLIGYSRPREQFGPWTVYAQYVTAGGVLEPRQKLGQGENSMEMAVALGAGGRGLVVWGSQGQAEESGPYDVRASVRVRDGASFGAAAALENGSDDQDDPAFSGVEALVTGDRATALFTAVRPGYEPTFAATADATGRFAARRKILAGSSVVNGIQRFRDGSDAVLYSTPFSRRNLHLLILDRDGRPAGPPQEVSHLGFGADGALALDPTTGDLVAAWSYDTKGRNGQDQEPPDVLAIATRR